MNVEYTDVATTLLGPSRELPDLTVLELFERHVRERPDAVVVVSGADALTYRELSTAATALAAELSRHGVGRGDIVAVATARSCASLVGLIAVWRAGGVYLPIDPGYPAERISLLLADANAAAVVADRDNASVVAALASVPSIIIDENSVPPEKNTAAGLAAGTTDADTITIVDPPGPDEIAYVIYTSGSTGQPKGVRIRHRSLVNVVLELADALDSGPEDRWISMAPTVFDISMAEFCIPIATGGRVIMTTPAHMRDAFTLVRLIKEAGVTRMQAVPSQWRMLLDAGFDAPEIVAMCGGEALPAALAVTLRSRLKRLVNAYGPTETTIVSTLWQVPEQLSRITIGRPIANTRLYLLDEKGDPVEFGEAGELCIGGVGVAAGYLRRPELTAQRFVPDFEGGGYPPSGNEKGDDLPGYETVLMYRSGDRCRQLPDGNLEYLGREDGQVKVRGQRIELGELESHLATHPAIAAVAAFVHDDTLVAQVIIGKPDEPVDAASLRAFVASSLPPSLVPNTVVICEEFSLTDNGKVDRDALHDAYSTSIRNLPMSSSVSVDSSGDWPQEFCDLCRDVLDVPVVEIADDLFDLGAHSLTVMQLAARIQAAWGIDVPADVFYQADTIGDLATRIAEMRINQ